MKASELRVKSVAELTAELELLLKEHFSMRMQKKMQQLTNTYKIKQVRRDIARVRTILCEKVA